MKCPQCGRELSPGQTFCPGCGYRPEQGVRGEETPLENKRFSLVRFLRALMAVIIAIGVTYLMESCVIAGYTTSAVLGEGVETILQAAEDQAVMEQLYDRVTQRAFDNIVLILLVAKLLTLLVVCAYFHLRHKNPVDEMKIHFVHPGRYLTFALLGVSLNVFVSGTYSLLPIPQSALDAVNNQYAGLYGNNLAVEILCVAVMVPIVEELIFRGIAMTRLEPVAGKGLAVVITALLFGITHGASLAVLYATVMGGLFAVLFSRYQSVIPSIITHMFFNLTSFFLSDLVGDNGILLIGLYVTSIGGVIWCLYRSLIRYPAFADLASDRKGRIRPINEEEARIAARLHELYEKAPEMDVEKLHEELEALEKQFDQNRREHKKRK